MTIVEYLDAIKECLLTSPVVSSFHVIRERDTLTDGHLRARLTLTDGSHLEFSEYVQHLSVFFIWKPDNLALVISARDMNAAERKQYGRK